MGVKDITIRATPEEIQGMLHEIKKLPIVRNPHLYSMYLELVKELKKQNREED